MPKEEIIEGLKVALSKGESMENAMMSFYNAGYSKEDIEDAASALQFLLAPHISSTQLESQMQTTPSKQVYYQPGQAKPLKQPSRVIQRVSEYGGTPSKTGTIITVILVSLFIILLGLLAAVFLFKDELTDFFNRVLGL